mmetsp:Transcript_15819/g.63687  ORF Transcript_15819/g.63687 Transcript_15819/m.63687 type:complete len:355 (-) Transcript_15819:30-1094(-)
MMTKQLNSTVWHVVYTTARLFSAWPVLRQQASATLTTVAKGKKGGTMRKMTRSQRSSVTRRRTFRAVSARKRARRSAAWDRAWRMGGPRDAAAEQTAAGPPAKRRRCLLFDGVPETSSMLSGTTTGPGLRALGDSGGDGDAGTPNAAAGVVGVVVVVPAAGPPPGTTTTTRASAFLAAGGVAHASTGVPTEAASLSAGSAEGTLTIFSPTSSTSSSSGRPSPPRTSSSLEPARPRVVVVHENKPLADALRATRVFPAAASTRRRQSLATGSSRRRSAMATSRHAGSRGRSTRAGVVDSSSGPSSSPRMATTATTTAVAESASAASPRNTDDDDDDAAEAPVAAGVGSAWSAART